jgi:hypothetical protein
MNIPTIITPIINDMTLNRYTIITTDLQLFDCFTQINTNLSPHKWIPCGIITFARQTETETHNDPYLKSLTKYFIDHRVICSTEICQSLSFCHPIWLALKIFQTNGIPNGRKSSIAKYQIFSNPPSSPHTNRANPIFQFSCPIPKMVPLRHYFPHPNSLSPYRQRPLY